MPIAGLQDNEGRAKLSSPDTRTGRLVRVMPEEEILRIASSLPIRSSCALNWSGVEVHRYRVQHHETPEHSYPQLAICISHLSKPAKGQLHIAGKRMTAKLENGSISITPPALPITRRCEGGQHEITVIFIDPSLIAKIAAEAGINSVEIVPQYNIRDPLIKQIGAELDAELASSTPSSGIYAESLGVALSAHILFRYANAAPVQDRCAGPRSVQIRRSIEFMQDNLHEDLTLGRIADVARMSKYHFAKSFRQAMGIAPHRYLTYLRISKARDLLVRNNFSIQEVAYRVGYADRSHFTAQFVRIVGTTPGRYQRRGFSSSN